jgi:hypothetical protein
LENDSGLDRHPQKKRQRIVNPLAHWTQVDLSLEVVPQAELHAARLREQFACDTEVATGQAASYPGRIEAHRIGDVIGLPTKLQGSKFGNSPALR